MSEWFARNYVLERLDKGLLLSVSLGDRDGGFAVPTWCWFVYDRRQRYMPTVKQGSAETLDAAKAKAVEFADQWSRP